MLDRFIDALTGRRLGGALFVLCGLVVAAAVLWPGKDEPAPARRTQPVRLVSIPQLGMAFAHPRAWSRSVAKRVIRLRSPEGAAVLTFASPVAGAHTDQVKADLKDALRKRFGNAKIVHDGPARLGRRKATSFELEGVGGGAATRVFVLIASSEFRTYVVTLVTPASPSAKRLVEAQQILSTFRISTPLVASKR
jgi:hypothetical protein